MKVLNDALMHSTLLKTLEISFRRRLVIESSNFQNDE